MPAYTPDALKRRFDQFQGSGTPGPSGGKQQLHPYNTKSAGSMFKKKKGGAAGRTVKALSNLPTPR